MAAARSGAIMNNTIAKGLFSKNKTIDSANGMRLRETQSAIESLAMTMFFVLTYIKLFVLESFLNKLASHYKQRGEVC